MYSKGLYVNRLRNESYLVALRHEKDYTEVVLVNNNKIESAYKKDKGTEYSFNNYKAKDIGDLVYRAVKGCKKKNQSIVPFVRGVCIRNEFSVSGKDFVIERFNGEVTYLAVDSEVDNFDIELKYIESLNIPRDIEYIELTKSIGDVVDGYEPQLRSVEEIALSKSDLTWLKDKKYYIVNDNKIAEDIFKQLESYKGEIAYDTETTGLLINCFGKIGSSYAEELRKYNEENPDDRIRADKLVGIIFCVRKDVSYYFPVANRKYKNLYEDDDEVKRVTVENIKARYTVGEFSGVDNDIARYIRNTEVLSYDVILMERVRNILEKCHIVTHGGGIEWKCGYLYDIDTNIKDDTLVMHGLMYKFNTLEREGNKLQESGKLKAIAKREFNIEQWELDDFYVTNKKKEKDKGIREKDSTIDFSYMSYEGSKIYAPADGDLTLQAYFKFKKDLLKNHSKLEYLYKVEVLVELATAYMEFYGHKIDVGKLTKKKEIALAATSIAFSDFREFIGYKGEKESQRYNELMELVYRKSGGDRDKKDVEELLSKVSLTDEDMKEIIDARVALDNAVEEDTEHVINIKSSKQLCDLFYNKLGYPVIGDKPSVDKSALKALVGELDENRKPKYMAAKLLTVYKDKETNISKFYNSLTKFMYPGGYIFPSYMPLGADTGRFTCSKPNAQQYPKEITKIVIPRDGFVMNDSDYSQIEYRVTVALSGEEKLLESFKDPDMDYHTLMASLMFGVPYESVTKDIRSDAKAFNFGIPFGMGYMSLAKKLTGNTKPKSIEQAKVKYELYFKEQPKVRKFFETVKEKASFYKYTKTFWERYRFYNFNDEKGKYDRKIASKALRQAGNAVIQGTAADIYKIGVARNFLYLRRNKLFGRVLFTNMVHDESLNEIDVKLNVRRVVRDLCDGMQFKINGFPPLYVGAGVNDNWADAKGEKSEMHPVLLDRIREETDNETIYEGKVMFNSCEEWVNYFNKRVVDFRTEKVAAYLGDESNYDKVISPAVNSLLHSDFSYGLKKAKGMGDLDYTDALVKQFIEKNGLTTDPTRFKSAEKIDTSTDKEERNEYNSIDDNDIEFRVIENTKVYGASEKELVKNFGFVASKTLKLCGIDVRGFDDKMIDRVSEVIERCMCDKQERGAMELKLLNGKNQLVSTGIYVSNIDSLFVVCGERSG